MSEMYILCKALIARGRTQGLLEKVDAFYAVGELTQAQWQELRDVLVLTQDAQA